MIANEGNFKINKLYIFLGYLFLQTFIFLLKNTKNIKFIDNK